MKNINIFHGILVLLFVGLNFFGTPHYETNDDFGMMSIVSGLYTGTPSEYIIFQNILLGFMYKFLYSISSDIHWYALFLQLLQFVAFWKLVGILKSFTLDKYLFWISNIVLLSFFVEFTLYLQFTKVAFSLGLASVLLLLFTKQKITGVILFVLSALIRVNALIGVFILLLPIFYFFLRSRENFLLIRKNSFTWVVAITIVIASSMFNNYYYSNSKEWSTYKEFNKVRGSVHDRVDMKKNADEIYETASRHGLSNNDTDLFFNWIFNDDDIYNIDLLKDLRNNFNRFTNFDFNNTIEQFIKKLSRYPESFLVILFIMILIFATKDIVYLYLVIYFTIILYTVSLVSFPHRLYASMILTIFFVMVFYWNTKEYKAHIDKNIFTILIAIMLVGIYINKGLDRKEYRTQAELDKYTRLFDNQFIFLNKSNHILADYDIWDKRLDNIMKKNTFYLSGWREQSPLSKNILNKNGYENIFEVLINKKGSLVNTSLNTLDMIKLYYFEHFDKLVTFKKKHRSFYTVESIIALNDIDEAVSCKNNNTILPFPNAFLDILRFRLGKKVSKNQTSILLTGRYTLLTNTTNIRISNLIIKNAKRCLISKTPVKDTILYYKKEGEKYRTTLITHAMSFKNILDDDYNVFLELEFGTKKYLLNINKILNTRRNSYAN